MSNRGCIASALIALALAAPVRAADYSDPTWPCIQRKAADLSIGLMWPVDPEAAEPEMSDDTRHAARELAAALALRRIDLEAAETRIAAFVDAHGGDRAVLGWVFEQVFDRLSKRRGKIMSGIADFSLGQIDLTERIDSSRGEMDRLMQAEDPDFDRVDALEERIDWDERIYTDRQKTLTYLCETPVLLEKRLYALAQALQRAAKDG